jgi:hypothetical protein
VFHCCGQTRSILCKFVPGLGVREEGCWVGDRPHPCLSVQVTRQCPAVDVSGEELTQHAMDGRGGGGKVRGSGRVQAALGVSATQWQAQVSPGEQGLEVLSSTCCQVLTCHKSSQSGNPLSPSHRWEAHALGSLQGTQATRQQWSREPLSP